MRDDRMCDVVRDLMPSYIEGLTSEGSSAVIREHLAACAECRRVYGRMAAPEQAAEARAEAPEIDYLRRTRKRGRQALAMVVGAAFIFVMAVFTVYFNRTRELHADDYVVRVSVLQTETGDRVRIGGTLVGDYRFGDSHFAEEDGVVRVELTARPGLPFNNDSQFEVEGGVEGTVRQVWLDGGLVWEDGKQISGFISKVYAAKIPYVGDAPGVGNIISALGVRAVLGSCTMELETKAEPYGVTVCLGEPLDESREEAAVARMRGYACAMLALIDNLGTASFEYTLDDGTGETHLVTVTENEATRMAGADIKNAAVKAAGLERLMTDLGLVDNYISVKGTYADQEGVRLDVILTAGEDINYVSMDVVVGNEVISSQGTIHADETPWLAGETVNFDITREFFEGVGGIREGETFSVQIGLETSGGSFTAAPLELEYRDGTSYETVLTGSSAEGFSLEAR